MSQAAQAVDVEGLRRKARGYRTRASRIDDLLQATWVASRDIHFHGPAAARFRSYASASRAEALRARNALNALADFLDRVASRQPRT